jgi:hypothetical protein
LKNLIKQREIKTEELIVFKSARDNFYKPTKSFIIQSYIKVNAIVKAYNQVLPVANQSSNIKEYKAKYFGTI